MAATVDLGQQLDIENVSCLPPRAPSSNGRPWSGSFHNRGRLFSPARQQLSSNDSDTTHAIHSISEHKVQCSMETPSFIQRRIQSATARLETSSSQYMNDSHMSGALVPSAGRDIAVYDVNMNLDINLEPMRRKSHTKDSLQHFQVSVEKVNRPSSAKSGWIAAPVSSAETCDNTGEQIAYDLKPSVYGYRLKRQVYGSNPDIFSSFQQPLQLHTMFKLDESPTVPAHGNKQESKDSTEYMIRNIPSHLEPLRPWLNQSISKDVIGADPATCLVFLPLNQTFDDLPVVPLT